MFDWEGVGRTPQTAGAVLEAAERAAEDGGQDWAAVRKGLAGELPAPRKEERVAERERQMAREEWRREAAEAAAAAEGVEMAAREAWRRAEARVRRAAANAGEVGEAGDAEAAELVVWAKAIGVAVDADRGAVRTAWRRAALRMHPDKGGDAAEFRARDSGEYVEYEIVQVEGTARAGVPARPTRCGSGRGGSGSPAEVSGMRQL